MNERRGLMGTDFQASSGVKEEEVEKVFTAREEEVDQSFRARETVVKKMFGARADEAVKTSGRASHLSEGWLFVCKSVCFLMVFGLLYGAWARVFMPKFLADTDWPTTATMTGFYELEKNTVDVLFLGSSHSVTAFIPQTLYDTYGITSYNLSSEQQGLPVSYYWLREALRFQKPKAVVLECWYCFDQTQGYPLNMLEPYMRKALDFMRWSPVKAEAVYTICRTDDMQEEKSYLLPNIRYHDRWKELGRDDFSYREMVSRGGLKGYSALYQTLGEEGQGSVPHEHGPGEEQVPIAPLMREYLDKITDLCAENDISLILAFTPVAAAPPEMCNAIQAYAEEKGLAFVSYNDSAAYLRMDYQIATDNADKGHPSIRGAKKLTYDIGRILTEDFAIAKRQDPQWERTKGSFDFVWDRCRMVDTWEIDSYLEFLTNPRYTVAIASGGEFAQSLRESTLERLRRLGLRAELAGAEGANYLAVVSGGRVLAEELSSGRVMYQGIAADGRVPINVISGRNGDWEAAASIQIDGKECVNEGRGLNLAVYDNGDGKLVSSVWCDTALPENPMGWNGW